MNDSDISIKEGMISLIIPIYNEEDNIDALFDRLDHFISNCKKNVEIIIVDDHSSDATREKVVGHIPTRDYVRYYRLSRNSGSHIAIICGFAQAKGESAVFLASDLQDPPELINELIDEWEKGNDVVWALREKIEGASWLSRFNSKLYVKLFNLMANMPSKFQGADFALLDHKVYKSLLHFTGSRPILGPLITSLGYKQNGINYIKQERHSGKSKWTLSQKINSFIDSFVGYSYKPLRIMSICGILISFIGILYALFLILNKVFYSNPIEGWTSVMVTILIIGGLQFVMFGVIGEYLWRNLEESRKRPLYLIEEILGE